MERGKLLFPQQGHDSNHSSSPRNALLEESVSVSRSGMKALHTAKFQVLLKTPQF